jgi:hypothetical protein
MHGLELLKKVFFWRIGDKTKVKILRDNWLPQSDALKREERWGNSHRKWVSELINPTTRTRDEATIRECCLPHDVETILSIKLPARACDDFVAWSGEAGEASGMFSVRSAYRLGMQPTLERLNKGQSSSELHGDRSIWNLVWKADVPQKLWVFAWKSGDGYSRGSYWPPSSYP